MPVMKVGGILQDPGFGTTMIWWSRLVSNELTCMYCVRKLHWNHFRDLVKVYIRRSSVRMHGCKNGSDDRVTSSQ
eukprot:scaffold51779_cov21-Tisochrysis_lutea.AAC.2